MVNNSSTLGKKPDPAEMWTKEFAELHSITIRYESPLPDNVPAYKYDDDDGSVVVLDSSLPPERQNFALAHEMAHVILNHRDEIQPEEEREADNLASELLLPSEDFIPFSRYNLRDLKSLFPHASFEAIARKRLAFCPGVLTIYDNNNFTRRLFSENFSAPPVTTSREKEIINMAFETVDDIDLEENGLTYFAVYIDDGHGVARVLLMVEES